MGTDAGTPCNLHVANAVELRFMTDIGISNLDAFKFFTSNAADLLTLNERGRIQKNCFADLLIVDGNPLENILQVSDRKNHRLVVKNGKAVVCEQDHKLCEFQMLALVLPQEELKRRRRLRLERSHAKPAARRGSHFGVRRRGHSCCGES